VITPGKRWRPPEPGPGVVEHMPEPTKTMLLALRKQLVEQPADQPFPPELHRALDYLINWALWRIDRLLTRDQIRYQRAYLVSKFIKQYIAERGTKRGAREWAYAQASAVATGPYAGSPRAMREDFLYEARAPGADPRSVRRREALEHLAREADKKRAQRRPRK
jgi:hypothetical protein